MWDEDKMEWTNVKLFKVNGDVKRFYDILSSKTIELFHNDSNYIYKTSNTIYWELQNLNKSTIIYILKTSCNSQDVFVCLIL